MTKTTLTRTDLIAQYRQLGSDIKQLRVDHIADIEKLIKKYKADKAALVAQRADLLKQIRTEIPAAEVEKEEEEKPAEKPEVKKPAKKAAKKSTTKQA